jgi:hypothetical protein
MRFLSISALLFSAVLSTAAFAGNNGGGGTSDPGDPTMPGPIPGQNPVVSFFTDLEIGKCVDQGNSSSCESSAISPDTRTIELQPTNMPGQFRGYYSSVEERDGLRWIELVTVDLIQFGMNSRIGGSVYTFTVEILDDQGSSAKMQVSVSDPAQLSAATLVGRVKKVGNMTYTPFAVISPPVANCGGTDGQPCEPCRADGTCPCSGTDGQPCEPCTNPNDPTCQPQPEPMPHPCDPSKPGTCGTQPGDPNKPHAKPTWQVLKGALK